MRWFGHVKRKDENSILRRGKKTWCKVVEEDMRKLNITEDMEENGKQWRKLISRPTPGVGN